MRVLIVEDDARMCALLRQGLEEEGHAVAVAYDGEEGLSYARTGAFDAIVLDVMLPRLDGVNVVKALRADNDPTAVLMLTARDQATDVVRGLDCGADDYLTKPFSLAVLLARLRAVSRRGPISRGVRLQVADLELDTGTREAWCIGNRCNLTRTEYLLLELLMRNKGHVVPRETIMDTVWGFGAAVETNTLDAFVRLLRRKLEPPGVRRLLQTVRGIGYTIREVDE